MTQIQSYLQDEAGSNAAEYTLIAAIIAATIVGALTNLGHVVSNRIAYAANTIASAS
jgi:pilus assembly protein Flp/PilA